MVQSRFLSVLLCEQPLFSLTRRLCEQPNVTLIEGLFLHFEQCILILQNDMEKRNETNLFGL